MSTTTLCVISSQSSSPNTPELPLWRAPSTGTDNAVDQDAADVKNRCIDVRRSHLRIVAEQAGTSTGWTRRSRREPGCGTECKDREVDAVVFDLDDTLIIEEDSARASLAAALAAAGAPDNVDRALEAIRAVWRSSPYHQVCLALGIASWEGLWASFVGCHSSLEALKDWIPAYRQMAWTAALRALGGDDRLAEHSAQHYMASQRRGHPLASGATAALHAVSHLRRGLLTNGPPDIQNLKVRHAGFSDDFDAIAISGELGVGKPSHRAFELVLERLGVRAERTVMVGDSWTRDIEPAVALGMRAIWVARGRQPSPSLPGVCVVDELDSAVLERVIA